MKIASWIIFRRAGDGKILLTQRSEVVRNPGEWNFPGGSTTKNKTPHELAIKEAKEEVGIKIKYPQLVLVVGGSQKYHYFHLVENKGYEVIRLNYESNKYQWFTLDELWQLPNKHKSLKIFLKNLKYVKEFKERPNLRAREDPR